MPMPDEYLTISIKNCARCRKNHRKVEFVSLHKESRPDFTHWGMCPKLGEPLLMHAAPLPETLPEVADAKG